LFDSKNFPIQLGLPLQKGRLQREDLYSLAWSCPSIRWMRADLSQEQQAILFSTARQRPATKEPAPHVCIANLLDKAYSDRSAVACRLCRAMDADSTSGSR
jgi:hypothetical protein